MLEPQAMNVWRDANLGRPTNIACCRMCYVAWADDAELTNFSQELWHASRKAESECPVRPGTNCWMLLCVPLSAATVMEIAAVLCRGVGGGGEGINWISLWRWSSNKTKYWKTTIGAMVAASNQGVSYELTPNIYVSLQASEPVFALTAGCYCEGLSLHECPCQPCEAVQPCEPVPRECPMEETTCPMTYLYVCAGGLVRYQHKTHQHMQHVICAPIQMHSWAMCIL